MNESLVPDDSLFVDSLFLGAREWLTVALVLALAATGLAIWSYAKRSPLSRLRLLALLLKITAVAALAFCLLEPMRRTLRPKPGANVMALVADNSRSMKMRPPGGRTAQNEQLNRWLAGSAAWQSRLAQDFDVRTYAFDDRLRSVEDLGSLDFQGNHSSLADAIGTLQDRFAQRPVAGLMLFTDGLATDDVQQLLQRDDFSFPIYPIVLPADAEPQDLSIQDTVVNLSAFELAPAGAQATLQATGLAGQDIVVRLLDLAGKTLEKQRITCDTAEFQQRVRFQFRPSAPGFQLVRMQAALASEDRDPEEDDQQSELVSRREITTANNSKLLAVDRGGGPYRILYVAGRPNWEFKFMRRALEEDIEIQLQGLVRIAKQEPKFSFRDRGVETANPLMAGFSDDEETTEQYDEPVLLRLGVEQDELKAGFPSGEEDLFSYHAIILDDVEAAFFTQQQMLLMRQFVAERGGGLMMLGGHESFVQGGYHDTPLGDVLPVYLRGTERRRDDQAAQYRLTREGALEPWLRLRANQSEEQSRVKKMPDFLTVNSVSQVKPGATVLAQLNDGDGQLPGLVMQRFGRGRSLSLLVGDFWRWGMRREDAQNDDLAQSWRQIARWLTADVPKRLEVDVQAPKNPLDPYRLVLQLRDTSFKPLDNASISLTVTEPDGQTVTASATPDADRPGVYVAEYWSTRDGGYLCRVEATGPDGETFEPLETGWAAQPSQSEFAQVRPDHELLKQLADKSQGQMIPIDELESFVSRLPSQQVPITEARVEPLWHRPWLILLAVGCLCVEWGLRRWKGLP